MPQRNKQANPLLFLLNLILAVALAVIISLYLPSQNMSKQLDVAKNAYLCADYASAYRVFGKLANERNAEAQFYLGDMFSAGKGVQQSYSEALRWYRKAADQGHLDAQFKLGLLYSEGGGVRQDSVEAYMWFTIAGRGLPVAVSAKNKIEREMTPEQIEKGRRRAAAWRPSKQW